MPDALHIKCVVFRIITLHSSIDSMVELLVASRNTFNRAFSSLSLSRTFFFLQGPRGNFETKNRRRKGTEKQGATLLLFHLLSFMLWIKVENEKRK